MGEDLQSRDSPAPDVSLCGLEGRIASRYGLLPCYGWSIILAKAVSRLCRRRGVDTSELLRSSFQDDGLMRELAGAIAWGGTGFFRNPAQLAWLAANVWRWQHDVRAGHPLRFWSIGCSTGEEPFSLAMVLADALPPDVLAMVEIVGTDINLEAIESARSGWVSAATLASVPATLAERFVEDARDGRVRLTCAVRDMVCFEHLSAREALTRAAPESFHAVWFCDVAPYLDEETVRAIHGGVAKALRRHGMLFVSPGDPPPEHPLLVATHSELEGAYTLAAPSSSKGKRATGRPSLRRARAITRPELPSGSDGGRSVDVLRNQQLLRELTEGGDRETVRKLVDRIISQSPRDGRAWQRRGALMLADSHVREALEDLRRASYLLGNDEINEYYFAVALERSGNRSDALRRALRLSEQLVGRDPGAVLGDGRLTVGALLRAAKLLVEKLL